MLKADQISTIHKSDAPAVHVQAWQFQGADAGDPLNVSAFVGVSLQVAGTFDTVKITGSNDGKTWFVLLDIQGNHMIFHEPTLADVGQYARFIRPEVSGDKTTNAIVWVVCRSAR